MTAAPETLPVDLPVDLLGEFAELGGGDVVHGFRVALAAAKELTATATREPIDPHAPVLRFLHLSETLVRQSAVLERHIDRYELERKAFLDDVARIGRINEENPP